MIGCLIQVVLLTEDVGLVADPGGMAHEDLHPGGGSCLPGIYPLQVDVPLGSRQVVDPHTLHAYLLHEFLVVRIEGIQGIDLVVMGHMRGGEVHREQGVEMLAQSLLRLAVILSELLRLIQYEDRPVGGDDVDGTSRLELVPHGIDDPALLVLPILLERGREGLGVDDHHIDAGTL